MTLSSPEILHAADSRPAASPIAGERAPRLSHVRAKLLPPTGWQAINFGELWRYRELTWFLALRDIKVRYKQTALGAAWAVIQPVVSTLIFTVFFNIGAGVTLGGKAPYAVAVFCGMLPWQLFETSLTSAGNSLVSSQNLISKVYFPRLSIPISSILSGLLDFAIGFLLLLGLMAWYHVVPTWGMLMVPAFVLLSLAVSLAAGLWLSALNVQYRDVRYAIPFLTRIWFFATPVVYTLGPAIGKKFGPRWQTIYGLNPMAGVVDGFRWAMLGGDRPSMGLLAASAGATLVLLVGGLFYFRRMEQSFADIV